MKKPSEEPKTAWQLFHEYAPGADTDAALTALAPGSTTFYICVMVHMFKPDGTPIEPSLRVLYGDIHHLPAVDSPICVGELLALEGFQRQESIADDTPYAQHILSLVQDYALRKMSEEEFEERVGAATSLWIHFQSKNYRALSGRLNIHLHDNGQASVGSDYVRLWGDMVTPCPFSFVSSGRH